MTRVEFLAIYMALLNLKLTVGKVNMFSKQDLRIIKEVESLLSKEKIQ